MFQTNARALSELLTKANDGRLQLPDFQRDYVWEDEDVQSLLSSVAKGYPIGAFLSLETGGPINFKPRLLAGVDTPTTHYTTPEELLLDGQQRITSLYQAIFSTEPVITLNDRGKAIDRYYYIDIRQAILAGADIGKALIGVPRDRVLRSNFGRTVELDLSTKTNEFHNHAFPINQVFPYPGDWLDEWEEYWRNCDLPVREWKKEFNLNVVRKIQDYAIPVIRLDQNNGREAICLIFEKVNTGGKPLDTFELLTAIYAADDFDLREDWYGPLDNSSPGRLARIVGFPNSIEVLKGTNSIYFLQACALVHTHEDRLRKQQAGDEDRILPQVSCNRETLLALPLEAYTYLADDIEAGFGEAASFLHEHKIISNDDIPYAPLLVGLAATFAILARSERVVSISDKDKITQWFWTVTLGEAFGASTDTVLARHVPELVKWIQDLSPAPTFLNDIVFQQDRLKSLKSRRSAAYKAIHVLLMGYNLGCKDFVTGKSTSVMTFFNDKINIHHIFPRAWCKKYGIPADIFDSIINKTPLSSQSNKFLRGDAPSTYLRRIEKEYNVAPDALDTILKTHLIDPRHLRSDDFDAFFDARMKALSRIISKAMDKQVVVDGGNNETERDLEGHGEYVDLENVEDPIDEIYNGESAVVEFKSTLRTNLHTHKPDKAMEYAVLKTIAGFLNTSGGRLFIGVSDDGRPIGLKADEFPEQDKMMLHLTNLVNNRIGPNAMTRIFPYFSDFENCRILVVDTRRSPSEAYVTDGNVQKFYIRTGSATVELTGSELVEYVSNRFGR